MARALPLPQPVGGGEPARQRAGSGGRPARRRRLCRAGGRRHGGSGGRLDPHLDGTDVDRATNVVFHVTFRKGGGGRRRDQYRCCHRGGVPWHATGTRCRGGKGRESRLAPLLRSLVPVRPASRVSGRLARRGCAGDLFGARRTRGSGWRRRGSPEERRMRRLQCSGPDDIRRRWLGGRGAADVRPLGRRGRHGLRRKRFQRRDRPRLDAARAAIRSRGGRAAGVRRRRGRGLDQRATRVAIVSLDRQRRERLRSRHGRAGCPGGRRGR